jgi:hypothetical protein
MHGGGRVKILILNADKREPGKMYPGNCVPEKEMPGNFITSQKIPNA